MNFIILGDKFQKRMKSKGCSGLIKVGKNSNIDLQYKYIKKYFPSSKIIYISGFESKKLAVYLSQNAEYYKNLILVNNTHYTDYNYTYSLSLAKTYFDNNTFILFGDTVIDNNTFKKFNTRNGSQILLQKTKNELGCIITQDTIKNIAYDLDNYLSNIYYICKSDMLLLKSLICANDLYRNYFIFEIINILIEKNIRFKPLIIG